MTHNPWVARVRTVSGREPELWEVRDQDGRLICDIPPGANSEIHARVIATVPDLLSRLSGSASQAHIDSLLVDILHGTNVRLTSKAPVMLCLLREARQALQGRTPKPLRSAIDALLEEIG